ncbi:MAG: hypothetical protein LBF89_10490 [Bacteroidales bacterium]|jgi:hypothetical protein|nr:hypothetical protein [Bacteroidales bacterium]
MNLKVLTHHEKDRLSTKVGDLNLFKAKILNTKRNLSDFELYIDKPAGKIYLALKHNPLYHVTDTGINI